MTFKTTFILLLTSLSAFSAAAQEPPVQQQHTSPSGQEEVPSEINAENELPDDNETLWLAPDSKPVDSNTVHDYVDEPAEFPGGVAAMKQYLLTNLNYPTAAAEAGLEGKCILQFIVSEKGVISDIKVLRGVPDCKECDDEAVRLVKGMPQWRPGKNDHVPVKSRFNLPVTFRL